MITLLQVVLLVPLLCARERLRIDNALAITRSSAPKRVLPRAILQLITIISLLPHAQNQPRHGSMRFRCVFT